MRNGKDMEQQSKEPLDIHTGDKIRIRSGPYSGARGVVQTQENGILDVLLDAGTSVHVEPKEITNFSLAARRAWKAMPKRAGRPQLLKPRKKMVSMRIDVEVWNRLGEAVELGLIPSREEAVNVWIQERLDMLFETLSPLDEANGSNKL